MITDVGVSRCEILGDCSNGVDLEIVQMVVMLLSSLNVLIIDLLMNCLFCNFLTQLSSPFCLTILLYE